MIISIRLVGGASDSLRRVALDPQVSFDDLAKLIATVTQIPPQFQDVIWRGELIPASQHPLQSIKEGDELVVKHALLKNWTNYVEQIEKIRKITTSGATSRKKGMALRGRELLSPLDDSRFFVTYPELLGIREEIDGEINFLVHNTKKYLLRALKTYFSSLFDGPELEFVEKPKQAVGVQLGFFVFVKDNSNRPICSYYAKTMGNMPKAEFAPELKPKIDLTELFVYQLFKIIGIGSTEVHIISDGLRSECVYLATKLIDNFFTASGNSVDQMLGSAPSTASKKQIVIDGEMRKPLEILAALLCLEDLIENKGNYGFIERQPTEKEKKECKEGSIQELKIVDFRVNVALGSRISKSKKEIPYLEKYFEKWNMMSSIDEARRLIEDDEAIKNNMEMLNKDYFDFYFTQIKKTLEDFINNPRKTTAE